MKRLLTTGAGILTILLMLGAGGAFADVGVVLEITNKTTGEVGTDISASAGDIVEIFLRVTNNGVEQDVSVNVVGGVVGCTIDETVVKKFKSGKSRKKKVQGHVPAGDHGTFTVDVTALGTVDGCEGSASGSVALGNAKPTNETSARGGILERMFVRMLMNALLDGIASDPTTDASTFGNVKQLYR